MATFKIGERPVGPEEPTFVIAEAGSNHNGDLETAKELIDVAVEAGADAVKFQTFRAADMYVENSGEAEYLDDDRTVYEIIEAMEMPYEWIPTLYKYCREQDIYFMSTPFDERSADELEPYVPAFKVASYTMSHHPFLEYLASTDTPLIISTGAHDLGEVRESVEVLNQAGCTELALLHCVAAYPTPLESINVRVIETLREEFGVPTGLSDHTLDPTIAPSATVAMGGSIVEKHFTIDKSMEGPDHQFALEPDELTTMVESIRNTETALGDGTITIYDVESELQEIARRRIHAVRQIKEGQMITESDVEILRSGKQKQGLAPKFYQEILGATATKMIEKDEGITWDALDINRS